MREKLADRICIISLALYVILFFAQIVFLICNTNMLFAQIIMFTAYNMCVITIMSMLIEDDKKIIKLIKVIVTAIVTDLFLIGVCAIAYAIKMI